MKKLLLTLEPFIWFMFGQGIMIGTMLLTGWVLVVGLLIPLGIVPAEALSYERAHYLATHLVFGFLPLGQLLLAALIALPLWKGAHHLRSLSVDFGGGDRDGAVGGFLYGIALVGSIAGVLAVIVL